MPNLFQIQSLLLQEGSLYYLHFYRRTYRTYYGLSYEMDTVACDYGDSARPCGVRYNYFFLFFNN